MTGNSIINIASCLGVFLIVVGITDLVRQSDYVTLANGPLASYADNLVVMALGVILVCCAAALTYLAAIDAKLHETGDDK